MPLSVSPNCLYVLDCQPIAAGFGPSVGRVLASDQAWTHATSNGEEVTALSGRDTRARSPGDEPRTASANKKRDLVIVLGAFRTRLSDEWQRSKGLAFRLRIRYLSPERPRRSPELIQIEATSRCNLRCPICSHKTEGDSGRHLTVEEFQKILDHLPAHVARVRLSGIGEPLLNPHFFSLVDALAARGINCDFFTNGTLLTPLVRSEILSRRNIDQVIVSCDGAQKATFEACRLGADFDRWEQLVGDFLTEAKQQRGQTLSVIMSTVVSERNLNELEDIIRLAAELGLHAVHLRKLIAVDDTSAAMCPSQAELSAIRREALVGLGATLGIGVNCNFLGSRWDLSATGIPRCTSPWTFAFIRANGDVQPCSNLWDSHRAAVMGNLLQHEFAAIWYGDRFREYRRTCALGTNPLCSGCSDSRWKSREVLSGLLGAGETTTTSK